MATNRDNRGWQVPQQVWPRRLHTNRLIPALPCPRCGVNAGSARKMSNTDEKHHAHTTAGSVRF